jgi:hypothetical protein
MLTGDHLHGDPETVKISLDGRGVELGDRAWVRDAAIKNVTEFLRKSLDDGRVSKGGNRALVHEIEKSQVVNPMHVIGMFMRIEDGVNATYTVGHRLLTQIGTRIDQEIFPVDFDVAGGAQALVLGIGR